jgi:hypothetical protein
MALSGAAAMARYTTDHVPTYRLHKQSGQAIVTLSGQDYLLGKHRSPESRAEYARLLAEWELTSAPYRSTRLRKASASWRATNACNNSSSLMCQGAPESRVMACRRTRL